jgi:hypothetical protein
LIWSVWLDICWSVAHSGRSLASSGFLAVATWCFVWAAIGKFFIVSVPANAGLVTKDQFGGSLRVYRQGLHIVFPWEMRPTEHFMSAEIITVLIEESFTIKDGGVVKVVGSFQYQPALMPVGNGSVDDADRRFIQYFLTEEKTIVTSFWNYIVSLLRHRVTGKSPVELGKSLNRIAASVKKTMGKGNIVKPLECQYGVDFINLELATFAFDKETQNALSAGFTAQHLADSTKKFIGIKDPAKRQDALVLAGKATKEIKVVKIEGLSELDPDTAKAMVAAFTMFSGWRGRGGQRPQAPQPAPNPNP